MFIPINPERIPYEKIYATLFLLTVTVIAFSQTFYIYTAKKSGYWYNAGNWDMQVRMDGTKKHKVVIPMNISIIVDNNVNSMGLGDIDVFVSGTLDILPNTTLNLSANSNIQLNNGTIAGNAANQQIKIGNTVKYKGDVDNMKTGYSFADNTTGTSPSGFRSFSALPVNFTSFYINKSGEKVHLNWSTDKEMNNSHFEVERSFDGVEWTKVAVIFGAGNSNISNKYSYNEKMIYSPVIYYRLRQVDVDSRFLFSSVKTIRTDEIISAVNIYGFQKNVVIDLNSSTTNNIEVSVFNSNGQVVNRQIFNNASYKINMNLNHISTGFYVVQVTDKKGLLEVKKIIL